MALRKSRAKRLKISTGDDRSSGATSSYVRKLNKQDMASLPKTAEERTLEAQLFGTDVADEDESEAGPSDWLSSMRSDKMKGRAEDADFDEEEDDGQMRGVADDEVRDYQKVMLIALRLKCCIFPAVLHRCSGLHGYSSIRSIRRDRRRGGRRFCRRQRLGR